MHTLSGVLRGLILAVCGYSTVAVAHFQELIPSQTIVAGPDQAEIELAMRFTHPMAGGPVMSMGQPARFGVQVAGQQQGLEALLKPGQHQGEELFSTNYRLQRPGDHIFYLEPAPYWEPGERKMIIHYTKVVVDAFGAGDGWDAMVGLPVEIEPLVRPYGVWTGNSFRGVVRYKGKPVANAKVEVEWRNDGSMKAPAGPYVTQVIKTDAQGVFSYTAPRAGWWGFAALIEAEQPMKNPAGELVPVELGGLIWVKFVDMQ
ncbi:MAG: DUF4198 domain-containing protein [Chromatiales bacterium]|nr:DUF4198 domain-containing protein [Chromatiales bacterium]